MIRFFVMEVFGQQKFISVYKSAISKLRSLNLVAKVKDDSRSGNEKAIRSMDAASVEC